jgi:hypothetical protein
VARLNDTAQWIILMGFLVSFSFFFLAIIINQSTIVGQTTAESVIEFSKNDIRDVRNLIISNTTVTDSQIIHNDITVISLIRKNAVIKYNSTSNDPNYHCVKPPCEYIHYNNGVTRYDENWTSN